LALAAISPDALGALIHGMTGPLHHSTTIKLESLPKVAKRLYPILRVTRQGLEDIISLVSAVARE